MRTEFITLAHGSGGAETASLFGAVFAKHFNNEILGRLDDSAVLSADIINPVSGKLTEKESDLKDFSLAVSTDSYVVTPLVFPGGDIGKLAVNGTVNDVLMSGAVPKWLTCGFIIEAGLKISLLDSICASMAAAAAEAGVSIIAGDTKVIEGRDKDGGLIINTTGIGLISDIATADPDFPGTPDKPDTPNSPDTPAATGLPSPSGIKPGDVFIVSGNLGDHHAAILSSRMGIKNDIKSDSALLTPIIKTLNEAGIRIHSMRDVTRGGLGTILNELARSSGISIEIEEENIPVSKEVRSFCGIMGLDPIYMGNEGKMVLAIDPNKADRALALIRETEVGKNASIIGKALEKKTASDTSKTSEPTETTEHPKAQHLPGFSPFVTMRTRIGGSVRIDMLYGEGLPRIC